MPEKLIERSSKPFSLSNDTVALLLCQTLVEQYCSEYKDDKDELSQILVPIFGETIKHESIINWPNHEELWL